MWNTNTYWFDIAIATSGLMLGHLFFGRFEEHKPAWRRLGKSIIGVALVVGITAYFGRTWTYVFLGAIGIALLAVHGWWLPKHGINGLTAEPRDKYYELIGLDASGKRRK